MSMIEIAGLTKRYGERKGIFDLEFSIARGEVFGYLGPNGSGKTTTIRHLMGFLNPDSGRCAIAGLDCRKDAAKIQREVGYLPGEIAFFDEMKGTEYLRFMSGMRGQKWAKRADELLERFQLDPSGRIKRMSKGMKQKLALVTALMHDPETLILDEPTSGLDPLMQGTFAELMLAEKQRGKTVLMSSHSFEEIEKTCDRVGILKDGRMQALVMEEDLRSMRRRLYALKFDTPEDQEAFAASGVDVVWQGPGQVHVAVTGDLRPFFEALAQSRATGLDVLRQRLEDIFISYYGGNGHADHTL